MANDVKVISPAVGTLYFATLREATARAQSISMQYPRSFAKSVSAHGVERGFVAGVRAMLCDGVWIADPTRYRNVLSAARTSEISGARSDETGDPVILPCLQ